MDSIYTTYAKPMTNQLSKTYNIDKTVPLATT